MLNKSLVYQKFWTCGSVLRSLRLRPLLLITTTTTTVPSSPATIAPRDPFAVVQFQASMDPTLPR